MADVTGAGTVPRVPCNRGHGHGRQPYGAVHLLKTKWHIYARLSFDPILPRLEPATGTIRASTRYRDGNGRRIDGRFSRFRLSDGTGRYSLTILILTDPSIRQTAQTLWVELRQSFADFAEYHNRPNSFSDFAPKKCSRAFKRTITEISGLKPQSEHPFKRPSRPFFNGPLEQTKNCRQDGHGTRQTGAVEPSRRSRVEALGTIVLLRTLETCIRHFWPLQRRKSDGMKGASMSRASGGISSFRVKISNFCPTRRALASRGIVRGPGTICWTKNGIRGRFAAEQPVVTNGV
ncbi:hypothetical protein K438DRAFT_2170813 [Mycena galopus ATCC 62051]|nr:hypothetical protein K438DRAFT_2170813 [Mycena galopus ATCC 62051]